MATKKQRETAIRVLMRALHEVERAQNMAAVRACNVDQSSINSAKDDIYRVVQKIENEQD
jgi:putative NADPH-quinone reductase